MKRDAFDRFFIKIAVDERGCWVYRGHINRDGYGRFYLDGRMSMAHRFSYQQHLGPIPDGLHLDHLCRNRRCVHPGHLEPVTHAENCARGEKATRTQCIHGHAFVPENTYRDPTTNTRKCKACRRATNRRWYARTRKEIDL